MPDLPKLKVRMPFGQVDDDLCDLEQARQRFNWGREEFLIAVEGQLVTSYEELVEVASRDCYRGREFIEVRLMSLAAGG